MTGELRPIRIKGLPGPSDPAFKALIPPPEPDPFPAPPEPSPLAFMPNPVPAKPVAGTKRVVVAYGPFKDRFIIGIEEAPDWDMESPPLEVSKVGLLEMLPILKLLGIKVKNLTGVGYERSGTEEDHGGDA